MVTLEQKKCQPAAPILANFNNPKIPTHLSVNYPIKNMKNLKFNILMALTIVASNVLTFSALAASNLTNLVFAESSIQFATNGPGFTNYLSGYDKAKYSLTGPSKSYLKFDFTGQNPNTNSAIKFSFTIGNGSGNQQHLLLWVLNQAYTGFIPNGSDPRSNPSLTWSNAQANYTSTNETDYNRLMTNGAFTATLVNDFLASPTLTVGTTYGVTLTPPWGQYLFNNQLVVVVTATNDANLSAGNGGGARFATNATTVAYQSLTTGTAPPSITSIANMTLLSGTPSATIPFSVSDPIDAASTLTNITVTLGNTNVTLVVTNIGIGSGGNRTLFFTPINNRNAGLTASVTVTVTVTDSSGNSATTSFLLTVPPILTLPVLYYNGTNANSIPPTNRIGVGTVTIPFQIVNTMTNITATNLTVNTTASPYSTNISGVSFTSANFALNTNNCSITITNSGSGVGIVNISIVDSTNLVTNVVSVAVMVLPDASYAAYDVMNYPPSTSYASSSGHVDLTNCSVSLWSPRSSGSVGLITSLAGNGNYPQGVPLVRGSGSGADTQMRLVGSPYLAGSHKIVYATILAQWVDGLFNSASAAYPGNSSGGFVEFAANGSTTATAMAAVCTFTNSANTINNDGYFYLGLYNSTNAPALETNLSQAIPNFSTSGVADPVVQINLSYDLDTGMSQMWLNRSSSADTNFVSLQDVAVTNLASINYIVLRQNANMGDIAIEGISVKVVTKPTPLVTASSKSGNTFQINFTCTPGTTATASVVGSPTVDGTYSPVAATITEPTSGNFVASITTAGSQMFYRIKQTASAPTVAFPF